MHFFVGFLLNVTLWWVQVNFLGGKKCTFYSWPRWPAEIPLQDYQVIPKT